MKLWNDKVQIYDIDDDYRRYLYQFDHKVNSKPGRRFTGIIVTKDDLCYFIPLTSRPLRSNGKRRNQRTTVEIYKGNKMIAALLINNMIPVPKDCFQLVDIPHDPD